MGKRKDENGSYWVNMRAYEKGLLEWALEVCADSPTRAAEMLGINASYLYERCKITNVERPAKPPRPGKGVADATPTAGARLKLVPELVEDEVTEDEEIASEVDDDASGDTDSVLAEDLVDTKDLVTTEDEEAAEDEDEDDEDVEEDVPDDECYCGAKLVTEDERERWIECTTCHTNRLTNAAGAVPAVMLDDDDDEEEAG